MATQVKTYSYQTCRRLKNGGLSVHNISKRYMPKPKRIHEVEINKFSAILYDIIYNGSRKIKTLKEHDVSYYDFQIQCLKDFGTCNIQDIKREFEGWNPANQQRN